MSATRTFLRNKNFVPSQSIAGSSWGVHTPLEKCCNPLRKFYSLCKILHPPEKYEVGQFDSTLKHLNPKSDIFPIQSQHFQKKSTAAGCCRMTALACHIHPPWQLCTPWDFALDPALNQSYCILKSKNTYSYIVCMNLNWDSQKITSKSISSSLK